jgi:hypothetical protein
MVSSLQFLSFVPYAWAALCRRSFHASSQTTTKAAPHSVRRLSVALRVYGLRTLRVDCGMGGFRRVAGGQAVHDDGTDSRGR